MNNTTKKIRSKTGCLTCRRRKKKCDETKPKCNTCVRLKLECEWPSLATKTNLSSKQKTKQSNNILPINHQSKVTKVRKKRVNSVGAITNESIAKPIVNDEFQTNNDINLIATMHITTFQGDNLPLSTSSSNPMNVITPYTQITSGVVSISNIREVLVEPDSSQYSSDEQNHGAISMSRGTSVNSSHKKSNYYLKRIAMQEDCVEIENNSSASIAVIPSSVQEYSLVASSSVAPTVPNLDSFINLNPSLEYPDATKNIMNREK